MNLLLATVTVLIGATVWSGDGPPRPDQRVMLRGERIAAIGPALEIPEDAEVIDLQGAIVTPGLVDPASTLGLVELTTGEPSAREGTLGGADADPIRAALRAADTFDPRALAVPVARREGITSAVVLPYGGVVAGQAAWVSLVDREPVRRDEAALVVSVHGARSKAGSRSRGFLLLREALEDARLYRAPGNRGAYIRRSLRELAPSAKDLEPLARTLEGELKILVQVDRASDILTVLEIARDQKLDAILLGVREGWRVADAIARARVPVIVNPIANLPEDFDSLESREDNAERLRAAGVRVAFMTPGPPTLEGRLRLTAGNAVARGYPRDAALAAITSVPAEIFGMPDEGRLRAGARADLVVWNGDPFEPLTWATRMFIAGRPVDLETRQELLTERYRDGSPGAP